MLTVLLAYLLIATVTSAFFVFLRIWAVWYAFPQAMPASSWVAADKAKAKAIAREV